MYTSTKEYCTSISLLAHSENNSVYAILSVIESREAAALQTQQ